MTLPNVIYSFIVTATVIKIVNYDHIVIMIVNYDPKAFIVQATELLKALHLVGARPDSKMLDKSQKISRQTL
jgi:hypothetical protein